MVNLADSDLHDPSELRWWSGYITFMYTPENVAGFKAVLASPEKRADASFCVDSIIAAFADMSPDERLNLYGALSQAIESDYVFFCTVSKSSGEFSAHIVGDMI